MGLSVGGEVGASGVTGADWELGVVGNYTNGMRVFDKERVRSLRAGDVVRLELRDADGAGVEGPGWLRGGSIFDALARSRGFKVRALISIVMLIAHCGIGQEKK